MVASPPLLQLMGQMKRKLRHPQHRFNLIQKPWQIQPFMIAPVLPGESLKNLLLQARIVTKPIKNALVGWWAEHYIFYVKLRDTAARDAWTGMFLNPEADMSGQNAAAHVSNYHADAALPDFVAQCLTVVTEEYFRSEGEAWNSNLIDTKPVASIGHNSFLDSLIVDAAHAEDDFSVDLNANATIMASEVDQAMRLYEFLQHNDFADGTFEDYLETYGVKPNKEESHIPELIRYSRQWTYPSNTVEPTTGVPSSACSWSIAERADKNRFFREPGFIFGVQVVRPKVYYNRLTGSLVDWMNSAMRWLPSVLSDDPRSSVFNIPDNRQPFENNTDAGGSWVDLKDLFLYGDQFQNHEATAGTWSDVALPDVAYNFRYATSAMADLLFTAASPANTIATDGVVNLSIATKLEDSQKTMAGIQ